MSGKTWGTLLAALAAALTVAGFVTRSVAAEQVRPVENRVTRLEALREEDTKRLEKMDSKLDAVLERMRDLPRR